MTVQETRQSEEVKAQVSVQGEAACAIQEVAHKKTHTSEATCSRTKVQTKFHGQEKRESIRQMWKTLKKKKKITVQC